MTLESIKFLQKKYAKGGQLASRLTPMRYCVHLTCDSYLFLGALRGVDVASAVAGGVGLHGHRVAVHRVVVLAEEHLERKRGKFCFCSV